MIIHTELILNPTNPSQTDNKIERRLDLQQNNMNTGYYMNKLLQTHNVSNMALMQNQRQEELNLFDKSFKNIDYKIDQVKGSGGAARQFVRDNLHPVLNDIRKSRSLGEAGKIARDLEEYVIAKRQKWLYENKESYEGHFKLSNSNCHFIFTLSKSTYDNEEKILMFANKVEALIENNYDIRIDELEEELKIRGFVKTAKEMSTLLRD